MTVRLQRSYSQSPEFLLRLLQGLIKHPKQIKQVHSLLITNGHLLPCSNASNLKWMATLLYNSLIRGYLNFVEPHKTLLIFTHMLAHQAPPNNLTFPSIIKKAASCSPSLAFMIGTPLHTHVIKRGLSHDLFIQTSLVVLYARLCKVSDACRVFEEISRPCVVSSNAMLDALGKNGDMGPLFFSLRACLKEMWFHGLVSLMVLGGIGVCTWNAMISSLACNGREKQALDLFEKMKMQGLCPDEVTFVAVITACARSKFVVLGLGFFQSMWCDFGVVPRMVHYGCVVDLLGRAGLLEEATEFIKRMPFEPDATVLGALLGACKVHGAIELGNEVGRRLLELQPHHCGRYVTLSNIYAGGEIWGHAADWRKAMTEAGISKIPAYSMNPAISATLEFSYKWALSGTSPQNLVAELYSLVNGPLPANNPILVLLVQVDYPANKLVCYVSDDGCSPLSF
ncbi:putative pentatricopeptide repeat-containing protein [Vitis vinifera]|uniref:Putative pentatricopeptide repeat-containing protein n=1 Tax=Vitis vinifera TaxID=29760 RepID=A0A438IL72_VITVI|nr:putative pentatricopeptide repeat-containing protein [Vitis vinifera]